MSMCGGLDQGGPTDEEFERNIIQYSEVRIVIIAWNNHTLITQHTKIHST